MCVWVWVCERERERERMDVSMCICVCSIQKLIRDKHDMFIVWRRDGLLLQQCVVQAKGEGERERERERKREKSHVPTAKTDLRYGFKSRCLAMILFQ